MTKFQCYVKTHFLLRMSSLLSKKLRQTYLSALADDKHMLEALNYVRLQPAILDRPIGMPSGLDIPILLARFDTIGGLNEGHYLAPNGSDISCALDVLSDLALDFFKCHVTVWVHDPNRLPSADFPDRVRSKMLFAVHKSALKQDVQVKYPVSQTFSYSLIFK